MRRADGFALPTQTRTTAWLCNWLKIYSAASLLQNRLLNAVFPVLRSIFKRNDYFMQYTVPMSLGAVKMFCKGETFKAIQDHFGITSGGQLIRMGVRHLVDKYKLELQRDKEQKFGFVITKEDKDTLYELADNEIVLIKHPEQKTIDDLVNKPFLIKEIEELHRERLMLQNWFNAVNDRILKIERHIKKQANEK